MAEDQVSFEVEIRDMFTQQDHEGMQIMFDLWNYDDVRAHADAILEQVESGRMPCYGAWSEDQVSLFRRWKEGGMQP